MNVPIGEETWEGGKQRYDDGDCRENGDCRPNEEGRDNKFFPNPGAVSTEASRSLPR